MLSPPNCRFRSSSDLILDKCLPHLVSGSPDQLWPSHYWPALFPVETMPSSKKPTSWAGWWGSTKSLPSVSTHPRPRSSSCYFATGPPQSPRLLLSEVNHSLTIFCLKFSLLKVCAFCLLTGPYSLQNGESLTLMLRCNQAFGMPSPDTHAEIFKKDTKPRKEMPSTHCHLAVSLQCSLLINSNTITWQRRNVQKKKAVMA